MVSTLSHISRQDSCFNRYLFKTTLKTVSFVIYQTGFKLHSQAHGPALHPEWQKLEKKHGHKFELDN